MFIKGGLFVGWFVWVYLFVCFKFGFISWSLAQDWGYASVDKLALFSLNASPPNVQ